MSGWVYVEHELSAAGNGEQAQGSGGLLGHRQIHLTVHQVVSTLPRSIVAPLMSFLLARSFTESWKSSKPCAICHNVLVL